MSAAKHLASELQAQSAWLKALARSLVGESSADDLVQEAAVAALTHAPSQDRPLRPWLRQVMVNAARMGFRKDQRRRTREHRSTELAPDPVTGPEASLARAELHRELVTAVLELDEPYRTVVLLRYVDDLSAAEIARQQGIPSATVRSQLKRGLDALRCEMDRRHGGRATWLRALVPLTAPSAAKSAAAGVLIMNIATASAATAAVVAFAVWAWPSSEPPRAQSRAAISQPDADNSAPAKPAPDERAARTAATRQGPRRFRNRDDRKRFAQTLAAFRARRARYQRSNPAPAQQSASAGPGTLDREYLKERVAEVLPLIRECYELALYQDKTLQGKLTVNFTIDAEEDVGGYVASATLTDPDQPLAAAIGECVTETIYSVEFEPPSGGGTVEVSYPFTFNNASSSKSGDSETGSGTTNGSTD